MDPDRWLAANAGRRDARTVKANGSVVIDGRSYSGAAHLAGQAIVVELDAETHQFRVWHRRQPIKRIPIKGLLQPPLAFATFVRLLEQEAEAMWRTYLRRQHVVS